jgi:hypothetical protein
MARLGAGCSPQGGGIGAIGDKPRTFTQEERVWLPDRKMFRRLSSRYDRHEGQIKRQGDSC